MTLRIDLVAALEARHMNGSGIGSGAPANSPRSRWVNSFLLELFKSLKPVQVEAHLRCGNGAQLRKRDILLVLHATE